MTRLLRGFAPRNDHACASLRAKRSNRIYWSAKLVLALILLPKLPTASISFAADSSFVIDSSGFPVRVLENDKFGMGERFVYDVKYGFIKGGESGIEIMPELVTHRGAPCYNIHTWAKSSATFSTFFKVRDEIHSYMDTRGIFTWYFEKQLNEGSFHDIKVVDYDQRGGKAYMFDDGVPKDTSNIPLYVQDAISCLFYFRLLGEIKVGTPIYVEVHDIRKTYPMRVDVLAREKVEVPAGKFIAFKVEPVLESAGIFKQKGRIYIWFSDDAYRMPVKMDSKVLIGSISAQLREYRHGTPVVADTMKMGE